MVRRYTLILALVLITAPAFAQPGVLYLVSRVFPQRVTVAGLTAADGTQGMRQVTDGVDSEDCTTGGGSTDVICVDLDGTWTALGGGGSSVILDLADDGTNESTGVTEIAVTGDTNSIFTEPAADKLLIAVGSNWPTADSANAVAANSVALGTDTTGGYAGSATEGGSATSAVQLDDADYGDVTSTSGTITVDSGAVGITELADDATCAGDEVVKRNAGDTAFECGTVAAGIGGSTGATDNAVLRADGTGGSTVQASGVTIDDGGYILVSGSAHPSIKGYGFNTTTSSADQYAAITADAGRLRLWSSNASGTGSVEVMRILGHVEAVEIGLARIQKATPSATVPNVNPDGTFDADTGIGHAGADQLSLIAGGSEAMRLSKGTAVDQVSIPVVSADDVGLNITAAATQTANLFEIDSNGGGGGDLVSVSSGGTLTANGTLTAGGSSGGAICNSGGNLWVTNQACGVFKGIGASYFDGGGVNGGGYLNNSGLGLGNSAVVAWSNLGGGQFGKDTRLRRTDAAEVTLDDASGGLGTFLTGRSVEANTAVAAGPNVLTSSESRKLLTNEGATAENHHDLPTAAAGLEYLFCVQDADGVQVNAATGDTIRIGASVSTAGGNVESTTIGECLTLVAINATEWFDTGKQDPTNWTLN